MGLLFDFYLGYFVSSPKDQPLPLLHLTMHLSNPPVDKLLLQGPSLDGCRTNFMNMVKQSDYVRWGNTRRVTSLRKVDQDALWEGVLQGQAAFYVQRAFVVQFLAYRKAIGSRRL